MGLSELSGKKLILNIFTSLDTTTCATSVPQIQSAGSRKKMWWFWQFPKISFAHRRFCSTEGINNVVTLSVSVIGTLENLQCRNSGWSNDRSVHAQHRGSR
jgi:thiol peroxidase